MILEGTSLYEPSLRPLDLQQVLKYCILVASLVQLPFLSYIKATSAYSK